MQYYWKEAKVNGANIDYYWRPIKVLRETEDAIVFEKFAGGELAFTRREVDRKIELGQMMVRND
jgi:hypothetical protein